MVLDCENCGEQIENPQKNEWAEAGCCGVFYMLHEGWPGRWLASWCEVDPSE